MKQPPGLSPPLEELLGAMAAVPAGLEKNSRILQELAAAVKRLSDDYIMPGQGAWHALYQNKLQVSAYLLYYLPVNLVKIFPLLDELSRGGAFDPLQHRSLSVLDIGCGPGTFMLGLLEYIAGKCTGKEPLASIKLTGLEPAQECIATAQMLLSQYRGTGAFPEKIQFEATFRHAALDRAVFHATDCYDIIIAGNVFTELPDAQLESCLQKTAARLAPGGALILLEPGTRRAARRLLHLRSMLLNATALSLVGPCLHAAECPLSADEQAWCHEKLFWRPTAAVRAIDGLLGFTKHKGIKYSYAAFIQSQSLPLTRFTGLPDEKLWRVGSYLISTKGQSRLWVCNGLQRLQLRLLDRNISETNSDFQRAERGDILSVEGFVPKAGFYDIPRDGAVKIIT